jgi:hypothetical protein
MRILSVICLSAMKALYASEIICGKIPFSLLTITFDIILYKTLQKLIGRKLTMDTGDFIFGMRAIWVKLIPLRIFPELIAEVTARVTSPPTMCQFFWKNKAFIPSGPGALRGCI